MIRRTFLLTLSLSVCFSAAQAADKIAVLLIDGQNNHQWKVTTPVLVDALKSSGAFQVTVSTTPDSKAGTPEQWAAWRPKFSDFAVVVSNYNGRDWPEPVQKEFEDYIKNGGGLVSVHAADNSFPKWSAYNEMIGVGGWGGRNEKSGPWLYVEDGQLKRDTSSGNAGAHGAQHEFVVNIINPNHPITKGLPQKWMHAKDELYSSLRGPAENLEVLSYSTSDKTHKNEPNMIVINYGKGRVFHTTLGHADYSMLERGFYTILQRGTEWAATGDVKACAAVPSDFNTAEKVTPVTLGAP